jgi:hypothetical protein
LALLFVLLAACARKPASLSDTLTRLKPPQGWTRTEVRAYDQENIYDLVDGQADSFFVYGFERVVVGRYESADGVILEAGIWQLATPADAYGLFTVSRSGEPVAIGNDGDGDLGRRLAFWQGRYVVQMWARQEIPQADLLAFGQGLAAGLPAGGERPSILAQLPEELRHERELIYFHQQLSIDSELWLGTENVLGLSPETEGLLVRLPVEGARAHLLLVHYPDAAAAAAARGALEAAGVESLVATRERDDLLGAVFGEVSPEEASRVLAETLVSE